MKKIIYFVLFSALFISCENSHTKTESFKVYGNCGMCKQTIENSLKQENIYSAEWNQKTKIITVSYDSLLFTRSTIAASIAKVGYDNEFAKAQDSVYNNLHSCCQYERAK